jgi:hypothetical protein
MDDRKNLSQPESVITTTEKSPSRNLQKKSCAARVETLVAPQGDSVIQLIELIL